MAWNNMYLIAIFSDHLFSNNSTACHNIFFQSDQEEAVPALHQTTQEKEI